MKIKIALAISVITAVVMIFTARSEDRKHLGDPPAGYVSDLYFISSSFTFTNETSDMLRCHFAGNGGWGLTYDGITTTNDVGGFDDILLNPDDSFTINYPWGKGPVLVTNSLY